MRLTFLLREGLRCSKLCLPRDTEPELRDLRDSIDILELNLDALPSFICYYSVVADSKVVKFHLFKSDTLNSQN